MVVVKAEVRAQIVDVARKIFTRYGFRKTTMEEIAAASRKGKSSKGGRTSVEYSFSGVECRWFWDFAETDKGLEITAALENTGSDPIHLENWDVIHMSQPHGGKFEAGNRSGVVRFFRWAPWDMRVEVLESYLGKHRSDNLCLLFDPVSEQSFMSAFITMDRMHCVHELRYSSGNIGHL